MCGLDTEQTAPRLNRCTAFIVQHWGIDDTGMAAALSKAFLRCLIREHTQLSRDHLTPELMLHLITPACHLWSAKFENSPFDDPFWAFYWPGGQALTRYIFDNPHVVRGKTVLDIGSGCGSSAIAASLVGASKAVANDIDAVAEVAISMNSEKNGASVIPDTSNYLMFPTVPSPDPSRFDIIFMGDMFYDPDFTQLIDDWLAGIGRETMVLIGDPGRLLFMEHPLMSKLKPVARYSLNKTSQLENNGLTDASVWRLIM
ncbi:methyltransferase-like 20 [Plakobranchus ocellatus]|uniref:ETFB lysine methyltransferase n=1 Tax=Plakobranchus ocellatus TaxID=259542 RepID=A0AAV4AQX1_9GAST|nr:methyltransferase-like 20 [Plakobranchus ocellatus]